MKIELNEAYDRWLYDNDFQLWMFYAVLRGTQEITTIERDALSPIDGKIIFNIDTKNWECWSKISNCWFNMAAESKDSINTLDQLEDVGLWTDEGVKIVKQYKNTKNLTKYIKI